MRPGTRKLTSPTAKAIVYIVLFATLTTSSFAALALDSSFGTGGRSTIAFPDSSTGYSSTGLRVFVQPGGRIVLGGSFTNSTVQGQMGGTAFAGLLSSGTLDPTFAINGIVTDWRSDSALMPLDIAGYPDGRILRLIEIASGTGLWRVRLDRLNADGTNDDAFSANAIIGAQTGTPNARPSQVVIGSDAKITVLITENSKFYVYRLNPDGTRDTTFGSNGVVDLTFNKMQSSPRSHEMEMVSLNDGRTLIVGHVEPLQISQGWNKFFVASLTKTGAWDKTFGRGGFLQTTFGPGAFGTITGAQVQPDGKILLCGQVSSGADYETWMTRFRPNGRLDSTFGTRGVVISDFSPNGDGARSVTLSPDGKIRLVGSVSPGNFLVARFSSTGTLEDSISIPFTAGFSASAQDVAIQPDGKLVVIGYTQNPNSAVNGTVFGIARLTE